MKLRLSIAFVLSILVAGVAFGQAIRTWVSGVGDDASVNIVVNGAGTVIIEDTTIMNTSKGISVDVAGSAVRLDNSTATQNSGAGFRATAGTIFSYRNNHSSDNGLVDTGTTQQLFYQRGIRS